MTSRRVLVVGALGAAAAALGLLLFVVLPASYGRRPVETSASAATPASASTAAGTGRKIKAHLYYVADDGLRLTSVERDVAYGEGTLDQAREIIAAQVAPAAEPLVSAVPPGTALRALFVTERGEAFVDLSREAAAAHPGGAASELLTIYTIVNALTANLPAVTSVQLLVDGKEVDTLAGHVDLRRPLAKNLAYVEEPR